MATRACAGDMCAGVCVDYAAGLFWGGVALASLMGKNVAESVEIKIQ